MGTKLSSSMGYLTFLHPYRINLCLGLDGHQTIVTMCPHTSQCRVSPGSMEKYLINEGRRRKGGKSEKWQKKAGHVAQSVECLPGTHEALASISAPINQAQGCLLAIPAQGR